MPGDKFLRRALWYAALAILLTTGCGSKPAAPKADESKIPVDEAEKQTEAARHLTADEVASLEAAAAKDPADVESRAKLLIFYSRGTYLAETRRINLWMIEKHPEGILVWGTKRFSPVIDEVVDPEGYAQGKKLWLAKLVHRHMPAAELRSAANYFKLEDPAISQKLLLRAEVNDADSAQLTAEYYSNLGNAPAGTKR
jgi:hypothetical protein